MKVVERLYLQKDKGQDVYVDLPKPLLKHQIDGIRFLYKQFKKKLPGVIINDPAGYGKCLQVGLFLSAAQLKTSMRVLILTHDEKLWMNLFEEWTDLVSEKWNRNSIQNICIHSVEDGLDSSLVKNRSWGIVVLHNNDQNDNTSKFLKMKLKTNYKIWITSQDMKEDLRRLSSVYEWLHPDQKFNVDSFTPKEHDWKDKIQKMIFLDAFLEDVLLRRLDLLFLHYEEKVNKPTAMALENTSRKNKDPTGTKVKRSKKRKIEDDHDEVALKTHVSKPRDALNEDLEKNMDLEEFIFNNEPKVRDKDAPVANSNVERLREKSDYDANSKNTAHVTTSSKDTNNIVKIHIDQINTEINKVIVYSTEDEVENSQNCVINTEKTKTFIAETEDSENAEVYEHATLKLDDSSVNLNENCVTAKPDDKNPVFKSNGSCESEDLALKYDDGTQNTSSNEDESKLEQNYSKAEQDLPQESISKVIDKEEQDNTNSKTNLGSIKKKSDDLDDALAALEAKTLQRIKGSILDRIF